VHVNRRLFVIFSLVATFAVAIEGRQTFRSGVDVIEIQAQVVGRDGSVVPELTAQDFAVTINGKPHALLSVDRVRFNSAAIGAASSASMASPPESLSAAAVGQPPLNQIFVLAIDALTFSPSASPAIAKAATGFVQALPDSALIGLYTFPLGPRLEPTRDHRTIARALLDVSGQLPPQPAGTYNLRASELIDYSSDPAMREQILRFHCGTDYRTCPELLDQEVWTTIASLEAQARASLGMLDDLVIRMGRLPGRKVLVLVSEGVTLADRPGGRPDIGDLPRKIGQDAARSNTMVYALFLDHSTMERYSASASSGLKQHDNLERDVDAAYRWLSQFTGSAGGALMKVLVGEGDSSYARIVRETAGAYVLRVQATDADMTGKPLAIRVKVHRQRVTVRSRQWAVLPARPKQ
jgi:VWFA-related protein